MTPGSRKNAAAETRLKDRLSRPIPMLDIEAGTPQPVRLQLAPIACWKCRRTMKAERGYIYDYDDEDRAFIALRQASDTRQIVALIAHPRKADPAITPVGLNYSKTVGGQYFSARCPHCGAICGDFHMLNASFFVDKCLCDYPDCECAYTATTQCRKCEYHQINLRLSDEEIDEIALQVGATTPAIIARDEE